MSNRQRAGLQDPSLAAEAEQAQADAERVAMDAGQTREKLKRQLDELNRAAEERRGKSQ